MMEFPLADAAGAVLISKKKFEKLPLAFREILLKNSKKYFEKLTQMSRDENKKAVETLKTNGIKVLAPPPAEKLEIFYEKGKEARRLLVNKLYSLSLVEEVENALKEFRNEQKKAPTGVQK